MLDQRCTGGFAEAGEDVYYACRQSAGLKMPGEFERGQRRLFRRLQHTGATGGQCGSQFPRGHQERVIPWNDLTSDAHGFLEREAESIVRDEVDVPGDLRGQAAIIFEAG